ncbi:tRNA-(ms[2]io[6]A)-hydroxylase [Marinobacterium marinum]|uniref:tRNA-(Ms[2]io[6]A)-hydroxylase n=1 Tax=Marinobacterium marinum TaxID=2756129 RepID=A0A7W1WXQ9_9GAMM|nr:tRNA isopentenyl-2-thiomethyl-A-37 hydroxylase MiaE [Marinobacterium marinum]MBA4502157.1 tRNA-(ms[2]io[6]A)-hydroxylase [Marinobacterium marinum]
MDVLAEIKGFLGCETPPEWLQLAAKAETMELLLTDHAHCEKKAASTAMTLMFRYVDRSDLLNKMSRLAREELIHFEQVLGIMEARGLKYGHLTPARYAAGLRKDVRTSEPGRLVDVLIIGAFIEARSCERFAALAPDLDDELARFYRSLLKSEGRHYQDYLSLAESYAGGPIDDRVEHFRRLEADLVLAEDNEFRFHSGKPSAALLANGAALSP